MMTPGALWLIAMAELTGGCLSIDLSGFPDKGFVEVGDRLIIESALSNGCNAPRVDNAMLHCVYDDGRRVDLPMEVEVVGGKATATATLLVESPVARTLACHISFTQCGWPRAETCGELADIRSSAREPLQGYPRPARERERPPQRDPSSTVSSGSGGMGDGMQLLGGLAVLAGVGLHASASSEEGEGKIAEADDHRKQGSEAIAGGVVLWLLGSLLDEDGSSSALRQSVVRTMRENLVLDLGQNRVGFLYRRRF
jgi:hypothetical protein